MLSTPRSRRTETGFNRSQERSQCEWFLGGDELASLYLLLRELAIGRDQERADRCQLLVEREAVVAFDAVHTRQLVVQNKQAKCEVAHKFQCGLAITCHDRSIGCLVRNSLNEE